MSLSPESLYLEAARRSIPANSSPELTIKDYKKYEFRVSITESKPLPLLPSSISDEFNPYFTEYPGSYDLNSLVRRLPLSPLQCPILLNLRSPR